MANTFYIAAGLQGNRDDPPTTGTNTFYITAGLPPVIAAGDTTYEATAQTVTSSIPGTPVAVNRTLDITL